MITEVYSAVEKKDFVAAGAAITGEITSVMDDINKEIISVKNVLMSEFSDIKPAIESRTQPKTSGLRMSDWKAQIAAKRENTAPKVASKDRTTRDRGER